MNTNDSNNWISLRDFVDERFAAVEKSTNLMREVVERRMEAMNGLQAQLNEQSKRFVSRDEHDVLANQIQLLMQYKAGLESKASQMSFYVTFLIAVLSLLLGALGLILKFNG
jgi:hypothetical protein